jgi:hypothetical protein
MNLSAIELYRDNIRLERDEIRDTGDLSIGLRIRPCNARSLDAATAVVVLV